MGPQPGIAGERPHAYGGGSRCSQGASNPSGYLRFAAFATKPGEKYGLIGRRVGQNPHSMVTIVEKPSLGDYEPRFRQALGRQRRRERQVIVPAFPSGLTIDDRRHRDVDGSSY